MFTSPGVGREEEVKLVEVDALDAVLALQHGRALGAVLRNGPVPKRLHLHKAKS